MHHENEVRTSKREPIAIVGMACRFPGGIRSPREFWEFLCARGDAISDVPGERWDADALFAADPVAPGRTYARRGGFLDDIDQFDPAFFGISPREAAHIDPQQRLLLEVAHEAMEDAGERWRDSAVRSTGVFVGVFIHDYQHMQFADRELLGAHTGTGTAMSIAANRISYVFDLHGPSMAVDTACSSSLVAVDLACKAIANGECDFALAGGVNVILKPEMTIAMSKATMLSKDGRCKSFDASADGYVRGEGAGVIVLRRLSDAIAAGNRIHAVIRGSGVNSDGLTKGISVPNGDAQEALTRRVLAEAGVPAVTVEYVEAHGTGTPVGDPIEAAALGRVFSEGRTGDDDRVALGSVKTNIGHLESASGVAGLIKATLCLEHESIPANLHFHTPNPAIDFERWKLRVVDQQQPWPRRDTPRRAAVNSFGFGGTNAHVLLEEAPSRTAAPVADAVSTLGRIVLPMGAHDAGALQSLAGTYAQRLEQDPACVQDLLYTVSQRRSHGAVRAALVANDASELRAELEKLAAGESSTSGTSGRSIDGFDGRPVFVFTGMGPQWWAMGRELFEHEPVARRKLEEVDVIFRQLAGWSILDELAKDEASSRIQRTEVAQPAIFALQVALAGLWKHWGVEPGGVIGHSVGEAAALHAAGVLSLSDATEVIFHRSRLQQTTAGSGGMLAVGLDADAAAARLRGLEDRLSIAAINGPTSVTLAGDQVALETVRQQLEARGVFARPLQVEVPYHSPRMDGIRAELVHSLQGLRPAAPHHALYSTVDGPELGAALGDAEYWWRNVRQPVRFASAIERAIGDGHTCFLEIGPHPVLRASIRECLDANKIEGAIVGSLRRGAPDREALASALGELHVAGTAIRWERIVGAGQLVELATYPFQRSRHWSESERAEQVRKGTLGHAVVEAGRARHPLLGSRLELPAPTWLAHLNLTEHAYLRDHKVQTSVVFPGTGFLEMALQTLVEERGPSELALDGGQCLVLSDVEIGRALYLADDEPVVLETQRTGDRWSIHGSVGKGGDWVRHASGRCRRESTEPGERLDLAEVRSRCDQVLSADYAYRLFRDVGLDYGPAFQAIRDLSYGCGESLARLVPPPALGDGWKAEAARWLFHPALLDACLHTLFGALNLNGEDSHRRGNVFLPVGVRELRIHGRPSGSLWSHARIHARADRHFVADIGVYDDDGTLIAEVLDLRCQALEDPKAIAENRKQEWMYEYAWQAEPRSRSAETGSRVVLALAPRSEQSWIEALERKGHRCIVVDPSCGVEVERLLTDLTLAGTNIDTVVHAWGCESPGGGVDEDAWSAQEAGACSLIGLVQSLAQRELELWVLTRSTQSVLASDPIRVAHSTLWGLRRVIANEHPQLSARIVDLDDSDDSCRAFAEELATAPQDDELAFRKGERFVHRLQRYAPDSINARASATADAGRFEMEVRKPGDLDSIGWVRLPDVPLGADDVELEVHATGLNFKDVMKATGLFPPRLVEGNLWSHDTLGMECAGRVTRVGARVRNVQPGDDVMALAPRSFASHAVTHGALVAKNPGLSPAAAAGVPVAFLTASVALEQLAQLRPGERVLIHAASGGVGQAAIQLAQAIGAEIFATAGSEAKRRLVRELGVEHVFDSRSLRFAEDVRKATGGDGVDVVLNSLAGDAITQSLSVLRDYGRFVEIGKMDLDRDFALGLRPFTRCLSFHAVDLDRMLAQRVQQCGDVLAGLRERLAQGRLRPLPVTCFEAGDAAAAFRAMAGAQHTGKLVVECGKESTTIRDVEDVQFRRDASYLITGGLGGFGLELARWMARRGAGHLILLGRRGAAAAGASEAIASLERLGASVRVEACDVVDRAQLADVLGRIPNERPLAGVFHAAAVLDDALIKNMDVERYRKTFGPKAVGAWNLHVLTRDLPLEHFMCFSSMASVLGNQGSANYCAANAFVDALAHHRRHLGLAALTVNWGVIADVGMAADEDFYRQNLERNGLTTLHSSHGLELLGLLLRAERVQTTVCPIDFETWLRFNPAGRSGRLKQLAEASDRAPERRRTCSATEVALREELDGLDEAARFERVQRAVAEILAHVFRMDIGKIDPSRALTALGADSLMAIEIKNRLEGLGLALSVTQLLNRNSASTLATSLLDALGYGNAHAAGAESIRPASITASWMGRTVQRSSPAVRLFCFPYAGGGPAVFHHWPEQLPDWVEIVPISLPGRGERRDEPPTESIAAAADAIVPEMLPLLDRPFALFGHCMGAILMYEVAQRLEALHRKVAVEIFASGCMAPHLYNSPLVHEQTDEALLDVLRLISFSGTRALIEEPELRATTYPMLRADFRAVAEYGDSFVPRAALNAPITGLAAENDLFAAPKAMEAWGRYTTRGYALAQLPGDHYFVESDRGTVIGIVGNHLAQAVGQVAGAPRAGASRVLWHTPDNGILGTPPAPKAPVGEVRTPRRQDRRVRVLCFPAAGIRAHEYPLPSTVSSDVIYIPVETRGDGAAGTARRVEELVDRAYAAIRDAVDGRTVFYGHCLGAVVAYEVALRLDRDRLQLPEHLLVAGAVGPHLYVAPDAHKLPDDKLIELLAVVRYPLLHRLAAGESARSERLALVRADLEAMASYQYRVVDPLAVPITAVSLRHDLWSYPLRTASWKQHTTQRCETIEWAGDHYEGFHHPDRIDELVRQAVRGAERLARAPRFTDRALGVER